MEGTAGVYYAFKDMKTYLRLFGMLAEMFFNSFESSFQTTFTILQQFLLIIHGCMRLVDLHGDSADFIKLYDV
jgi:hypothetical protein